MKSEQPGAGGYFQRDRSWHPPALTPLYKTSLHARRSALQSRFRTRSQR